MNTKTDTKPRPAVAHHMWLSGRIVVGVDGSDSSNDALRHAVQLAIVGGARLELVAAWQTPLVYGPAVSLIEWSPRAGAEEVVRDTVQRTFGDDIPDFVTTRVVEGTSAQVLIEASRDADLLVVGSRGLGGFAGLLLGSVSSACATHASCPVLVVHESGARLPETASKKS